MWKRIRRCALASSVALAALLTGCRVEAPEGNGAATGEEGERRKVLSFWQLNREANRLRLAGDLEAAVEQFEAALEIDPSHEDSLYYLGISLEGTGEYARAEATYRRILELNPESNRAVTQLADVKSRVAPGSNPDFAEAHKLLERSIAINREHSGPYLRLGRLALMQGDTTAAIQQFETAAGFGSAEGDLMAGLTLLLRGEDADAEERFRAVRAAAERERARAARGERAEGDVRPQSGRAPASPLQSAAARAAKLLDRAAPGAVWRDVTAKAGLPRDGGRIAWGDYDGDGWVDALILGRGPARLFRNRQGRFERVAAKAVEAARDSWDAAWGDIDGDGDLDLYVVQSGLRGQGANRLLRNETDGAFVDVTADSGLGGSRSTYAAAFADLDGDGAAELIESGSDGLRVYRRGGGSWIESSGKLGVASGGAVFDFGVADFDRDQRADLIVRPWRKNVRLYLHGQGESFADVTDQAGLAGQRGRGYGAVVFDYDRDGLSDIGWADPPGAGPATLRLFLNAGNGSFEESSWGGAVTMQGILDVAAGDFDGDGRADLLLAGGSHSPGNFNASGVVFHDGESAELPLAFSLGGSAVDVDQDGQSEVYLAGSAFIEGSSLGRARLLRLRGRSASPRVR